MACEINSGDELVATEMIFAGVLTELTPEEAVALLSALVFQVQPCSCPFALHLTLSGSSVIDICTNQKYACSKAKSLQVNFMGAQVGQKALCENVSK